MSDRDEGGTTEIRAGGSSLSLDLEVGHIRDLSLRHDGHDLRPLYHAPWLDEDPSTIPGDVPTVPRRLGGDFMCAPFCHNDLEGHEGPLHGLTASSRWRSEGTERGELMTSARFELEHKVMGATVKKEITLSATSPLLHQRHTFSGGRGRLTASHHVNVHMIGGGHLRHSGIDHAWTAAKPQDPGFNRLAYPARSADLSNFPGVDGGAVDLGAYPLAEVNEDFLTLVDSRDVDARWTAVQRKAEGDILFTLKPGSGMPVTMLWYCNGGRSYPPWNSRAKGVLGIENGIAYDTHHKDAVARNHMAEEGFPTCVTLERGAEYAPELLIGAVKIPEGWGVVREVSVTGKGIAIGDDGGMSISVEIPDGFPVPRVP